MLQRLLKINKNHSVILFGARGTGKSTLTLNEFNPETTLWIDLLDPANEDRFARHPGELSDIVLQLPEKITHIVIDEIQKLPRLLDVVHGLIEKTAKIFVMTG